MQEFGKVNMLKVLGSMLGLATLMGVLGAIVTTGVGALIMGVGAVFNGNDWCSCCNW